MNKQRQHITIKYKAKKGLLFFTLLLSLFMFSGVANIAQQNNPHTNSELVFKACNVTTGAIRYKIAAHRLYRARALFLTGKCNHGSAILVFDKLIAIKRLHITTLASINRQAHFQYYTNIPHATEPAQQPSHRA